MLTEQLIAARKQMRAILMDETASISGAKGSYKFKYASLYAMLEVVNPPLLENGIVLVQAVGTLDSNPNLVAVTTKLISKDETMSSPTMYLVSNGEPKDIAARVTSARRIQLISFLGLAPTDEEDPPASLNEPIAADWQRQAPLRKAANAPKGELSMGMRALINRCQQADVGEVEMPTKPAEGKQVSMFHYLCSLLQQYNANALPVLSVWIGRAITEDTPPKLGHKFLIDELREGRHIDEIKEALKLASL